MALREDLLKLAKENPELRPHLLPLIRQGADKAELSAHNKSNLEEMRTDAKNLADGLGAKLRAKKPIDKAYVQYLERFIGTMLKQVKSLKAGE